MPRCAFLCCQWRNNVFNATKSGLAQRPFFHHRDNRPSGDEKLKVIDNSLPVSAAYRWQCSRLVEDISPTVINPRGVNTSRFISCKKLVCSWARRCKSDARRHPGLQGNAGLWRSDSPHPRRNPSTPRSAQNSQTFFSSARTAGFSQLRSACSGAKRCK